jgi:hypothetical protein
MKYEIEGDEPLSDGEIYHRIRKFTENSDISNLRVLRNICVELIDDNEYQDSYYNWEKEIVEFLNKKQ